MTFLQNIKFSNLTFIAGVFFVAVILSACASDDTTQAAVCDANEDFAGDGTCVPYLTSQECKEFDFKDVDNKGDCVAYTEEDCASTHVLTEGRCIFLHEVKALSHFTTDEYKASNTLEKVGAAQAYANIEKMLSTDLSGTIRQGGQDQIVVVSASGGFNTQHQEFTIDGVEAAVFDSIRLSPLPNNTYTSYYSKLAPNEGRCPHFTSNPFITIHCGSSKYAALVAGRKDDTGMHGIAYNAHLQGIEFFISGDSAGNAVWGDAEDTRVTFSNGPGANVVAMTNIWDFEDIDGTRYLKNLEDAKGCAGNTRYTRPKGKGVLEDGVCGDNALVTSTLADIDLNKLKEVVSDPNKTIMVFGSGNIGFNSETGIVKGWHISGSSTDASATLLTGSAEAANIPGFYAAYPALHDDDGLNADRWLVVVGLAENNTALAAAHGCGIAMNFCMAAPAENLYVPPRKNRDNFTGYETTTRTYAAAATVSGALAVLKGAFPLITPEKLAKLALETSTYLPLDNRTACISTDTDCESDGFKDFTDPDDEGRSEDEFYRVEVTTADGGTRYINPVYGYGILNLEAATAPSITGSYVTASDNESIGALWADTKLTLSSHFGSNFESVTFGIGDAYGRHFVMDAPQVNHTPVAVGLDDYMGNLLAENVQSQRLGGQAQANYSNSGENNWMNLEYISGNATTKIAFQDSYKINPLNAVGTTTILRANNIRPASTNIGMMDVDYKLGNLTLSSYVARGEYDTGYKFDELGTDFDVNYKDSHLNIAIGNIREHGQFLGTNTSGAYALNAPSISRFTDVTYGHDIGAKFNIYANYINYETDVDMLHDQFASINNLQADQYQIGFTGKNLISKDDSLNVALITKLGVTDGALNQNTVQGYTADGGFNNVNQSYDLAVGNRHQQFEITYQGRLYQNTDKISKLRDNRFFTSIRVDSNLNHVEGLGQVEVVSGINIRY